MLIRSNFIILRFENDNFMPQQKINIEMAINQLSFHTERALENLKYITVIIK
jgi:hypothetical protein